MLEIAREEAMIKQGVCMFSRQNKGFELRGWQRTKFLYSLCIGIINNKHK